MAIALVACAQAGCGEASDDPSDCTPDQYYDEARGLCQLCPSVSAPTCREGCGFTIARDERGCPQARCAVACDLCPQGQAFSEQTLSCQPVD